MPRPRTTYPRLAPPAQIQAAARDRIDRDALLVPKPYGWPTEVVTADYVAKFSELVRVDPTGGPLTIRLPSISHPEQVGGIVSVLNVSGSTNIITVRPADADATINGVDFVTMEWAYGPPATFLASMKLSASRLWVPGNVFVWTP